MTLLEMDGNGWKWDIILGGPLKASNLHLILSLKGPAAGTAEDASAVNSSRGDTMRTASRIADRGLEWSNRQPTNVFGQSTANFQREKPCLASRSDRSDRTWDSPWWITKGPIGAYKDSGGYVLYPSKCASIDQYVSSKGKTTVLGIRIHPSEIR